MQEILIGQIWIPILTIHCPEFSHMASHGCIIPNRELGSLLASNISHEEAKDLCYRYLVVSATKFCSLAGFQP
jgi:hypothetical protein